jgi:hypothetical protein
VQVFAGRVDVVVTHVLRAVAARAWKHFEQEQLMVNEAMRENVATAMRRIGSGFGPGRFFKLRIVDAELLQVGIET